MLSCSGFADRLCKDGNTCDALSRLLVLSSRLGLGYRAQAPGVSENYVLGAVPLFKRVRRRSLFGLLNGIAG